MRVLVRGLLKFPDPRGGRTGLLSATLVLKLQAASSNLS